MHRHTVPLILWDGRPFEERASITRTFIPLHHSLLMINNKSAGPCDIFRWGGRWMRLWCWPLWVDVREGGRRAPPPTVGDGCCRCGVAAERWSVLIEHRLSASQPISLVPHSPEGSSAAATSLRTASLLFALRTYWPSVGRFKGEEAKHRQVLTSGETLRCSLMTMMMVRMMHLFPCLFELHRVAWRGSGASGVFPFFLPFSPVMVDFLVALRLRV